MSKSTVLKYTIPKHRATLYKRTKILKENKLFEGMNSFNTNTLEIGKPTANQL